MTIAAFFAIILAFFGKLGAVLKTIPSPVMGGILVLLFGMIAAIGIGTLINKKVDMSKSRNLVIVSIILVFGIGDMALGYGEFQLAGIGLAGIIGVILNRLLPQN
jgi:uracil permease